MRLRIQAVKSCAEVKIHDIEVKQKEGENRLMEISQKVDLENEKMKSELDELRLSLDKLQTAVNSLEYKCQFPPLERNASNSQNTSQSSFDIPTGYQSSQTPAFSRTLDQTI